MECRVPHQSPKRDRQCAMAYHILRICTRVWIWISVFLLSLSLAGQNSNQPPPLSMLLTYIYLVSWTLRHPSLTFAEILAPFKKIYPTTKWKVSSFFILFRLHEHISVCVWHRHPNVSKKVKEKKWKLIIITHSRVECVPSQLKWRRADID